jgi:nucleotide-binding universal stress UspA family protein
MFHKILVAVDNSTISQWVFEQALSLAKAANANLMLLHVLSSEEEGSPRPSLIGIENYPPLASEIAELQQKEWIAYEKRGLEMLRSYIEEASVLGVGAEFTQNVGSPGRTICDVARTWNADLIVVGRRGHTGLSELLLGSVSNYVLHHAPCSVLTVQRRAQSAADTAPEQHATAAS